MKRTIWMAGLAMVFLVTAGLGCKPRDAKKNALLLSAPPAASTGCLDNFKGALDLSGGYASVTDNTCNSSNHYSYVYGYDAPDHVYSFVITEPGQWVFTTCDYYDYDTSLKLTTTCMGDNGEDTNVLAYNDDSCGLGSYISHYFATPGTYYIVVDACSSGCGGYTLEVYEGSSD